MNDYQNIAQQQREPYDALSDRFSRGIEICLKYFRSYCLLQDAKSPEIIRDLLLKAKKYRFIQDVNIWLAMRDLRNRIAHDYLPGVLKSIYDDIKQV